MKILKDLAWKVHGAKCKFEESMGGPAARDLLLGLKGKTTTLKHHLLSPRSINGV